jgi:WD40 repeat protein
MLKVEVQKVHTLRGHRDSVYTLQGSSDNRLFFSGSGDGMVVLWDMESPEEGQLIAKLPNSVYALHHHSHSDLLIAGHNYDGIHVLDWKNKKELGSLQLTTAPIFDIQSLEGELFIATGDGGLIKVDAMNLTILGQSNESLKSARSISVSKSRGEIAVGYSDNFIRIFDSATLKLKHQWTAHQNSVFTVRFTPDESLLLSGSRDARLKAWNPAKDYSQDGEVVAHLYAINYLDFSPNGKHFVTCSMDKSIKVWDAEKLKLLKVIDKARHAGHGTSVNKVLWTSYHDQVVSASDDRTISIWNIDFE